MTPPRAIQVALLSLLLGSYAEGNPHSSCVDRIKGSKALKDVEKTYLIEWVETAGYSKKEKNVKKAYAVLNQHASLALEIVKCYLNTSGKDAPDDEKYGILYDLPRDLKANTIDYAISLYKSDNHSEFSNFNNCWGQLLFDLDSSGYKVPVLTDTSILNGYNEVLLKNAILNNYGIKIDTTRQIEKTRQAYELEFKNEPGVYDTLRDLPLILRFYQKVGQKQKLKEADIPFIGN